MYDWSVLYLRQELGAPTSIASMGYASFSGAMAASRFGGDWVRACAAGAAVARQRRAGRAGHGAGRWPCCT